MGRESLARATQADSLAWDDNHERAVDRLTAIGMAGRGNELGALLLRVDALDKASLRKVVLIVARKLHHKLRITIGFGERIAEAALHEYLHPHCHACGGNGVQHELKLTCPVCGGNGIRRYSDRDRVHMVGGNFNRKAYEVAMTSVRNAMVDVVRVSNARLE